jgi:predicted nuclease of restriction endonuclease-like (RecB) superfamily
MKRGLRKTSFDYASLLGDVKSRIQQAQSRAVLAANAELVRLYWDIGRTIDARQKEEGYGTGVIPRLARDLHNELPDQKGFSERNIGRMIAFSRSYPAPDQVLPQPAANPSAPGIGQGGGRSMPEEVLQQPVAKAREKSFVPQAAAQPVASLLWLIPWGHHAVLLAKVKNLEHRLWYMQQTLRHGWSRNVLGLMIGSDAHLRQGQVVNNFDLQLPAPQSDLVQQTLKDPYIFDFLTLAEPFHERELETGLLQHLERFLIELGQGFAFVGRQYRVEVGDEDFYIDLLFYHLRLRCFLVIDLKRGRFKAEYAGKLNCGRRNRRCSSERRRGSSSMSISAATPVDVAGGSHYQYINSF